MSKHGLKKMALLLLIWVAMESCRLNAQTITGNVVTNNLTVTGDTITIGAQTGTTNPGWGTIYTDGTNSLVEFQGTRSGNTWEWQQSNGSILQMTLDYTNTLTLYNSSGTAEITLSPTGTSSFYGSVIISGTDNEMPNQTLVNGNSVLTENLANTLYASSSLSSAITIGTSTFGDGSGPTISLIGGSATGPDSFAEGIGATASGIGSTAMGLGTTASGYYGATAMGRYSTASGYIGATAMGIGSTASGLWGATAMGLGSIANGQYGSTAMGESTASGNGSTAMGQSTASGNYSTAMGGSSLWWMPRNTASGNGSTAMGDSTASGNGSTAMGQSTASGYYSTAMGQNSSASGNESTAMGNSSASGNYSTAMGYYSWAGGNSSTVMGLGTTASGNYSTAMGNQSSASGNGSTASGLYATASAVASFVIGTYNVGGGNSTAWIATDPLFEIGNGGNSSRYWEGNPTATGPSDAFVVYKNGNAAVQGTLNTGGTTTSPAFITTTQTGDIPMYTGTN